MNIDEINNTKRCCSPDEGGCGDRLPKAAFYTNPGKLRKDGSRANPVVSKLCRACTSKINGGTGQKRYAYKRGPEKPKINHCGPRLGSPEHKFFCT